MPPRPLLLQAQARPEAIQEAQKAVTLAPDIPNTYYVLGSVLDDVGRFKEAEAAAREALRLDPEDADYYALASSIRLQQKQWADALALANLGLSHDPDHVPCTNLKAMAQVNLGQRQEAGVTIGSALAKDPDNALSHANQGWADLHRGDHKAALDHFREALRLNPQMEWARQGILEALRARNPLYALLLRYFLWMSRLRGRLQMGVVMGAWVGNQVIRSLQRSNPALAPYLAPLVIAYLAFAYLTWTARPLFNLLLRLDRFGRLALNRDQIVTSNWFGVSLLIALACLVGAVVTNRASLWFLAVAFVLLTIPVAATGGRSAENGRKVMALCTAGLAALACVAATVSFVSGPSQADNLFLAFYGGCALFVWITNAVGVGRDYR